MSSLYEVSWPICEREANSDGGKWKKTIIKTLVGHMTEIIKLANS